MKSEITYKRKNTILIVSIFLLLFISYKLSFKKSIEAYTEYLNLSHKIELTDSLPYKINILNESAARFQTISIVNKLKESEIDRELLKIVSEYCVNNKIKLQDFPGSQILPKENYQIMTSYFITEGSFSKVVKLIFELEQNTLIGKIISAKFNSDIDFRTRKKVLHGTIYIQNVLRHE